MPTVAEEIGKKGGQTLEVAYHLRDILWVDRRQQWRVLASSTACHSPLSLA
jgi:hypothetical protein